MMNATNQLYVTVQDCDDYIIIGANALKYMKYFFYSSNNYKS